jgi:hypothetical protein
MFGPQAPRGAGTLYYSRRTEKNPFSTVYKSGNLIDRFMSGADGRAVSPLPQTFSRNSQIRLELLSYYML